MDDVSKLAPEKAVEIIERTLFAHGFTIIQIDSETVQVTGTGRNPRVNGVPMISDPKDLPNNERLVTVVFRFKHREALEMQQTFGQYVSPPNTYTSLIPNVKSKTLLVTERSSVIRSLLEIAAKMDVPDAPEKP